MENGMVQIEYRYGMYACMYAYSECICLVYLVDSQAIIST